MSLHPISRALVCATLLGGLAPATSGAQQQLPEPQQMPPSQGGITNTVNGMGRNPKIIVVAPDNMTPLFWVECEDGQNIGECLDTTLNSSGVGFAGIDDNRIATLVSGHARIGSILGFLGILWNSYSYDDLYIDSDVRLRAAE